jgi:predicted ferric reductase
MTIHSPDNRPQQQPKAQPRSRHSSNATVVNAVNAVQFRRRSRRADAMAIASWSSAAAAVALFLAAGGASRFTSPAEIVTSFGVIAGLVGTDLVLVMLVLAARIPAIDQAVGYDRAMALHRTLGKPALYLLLGHAALLLIGYGMREGINPIAEIFSLWGVPDMPLAFLGLGLLIAVVVTSLSKIRRRYPYETWHVIHLLSYAAVLVAVPHQLSLGGIFAAGSIERVYWLALYIFALGSIVTFRIVEPVVSTLRHRLTVERVAHVAPDVVSIHFSGNSLQKLGSRGGQFFVWRFWTGKTWGHSHPISLSALPTDHHARITIRTLGKGTARLATLPVGTRVSIQGPYGLFTDAARTAPKLAIVAAGIGVTPVRALLEHSRIAPGEATILLRASTANETYLWNEMATMATSRRAAFYTMVGRRPKGISTWMSEDEYARGVSLRSIFSDLLQSDLYVCGPTVWSDLVVRDARALGLPSHQIHTERFDW